MNPLPKEKFLLRRDDFNRAVLVTPSISTVCCGIDWLLAASSTLHRPDFFYVENEGEHWLAFGKTAVGSDQVLIHPLELAWGFSCPILGPDDGAQTALLENLLHKREEGEAILITGISAGSALEAAIESRIPDPLWQQDTLLSVAASLENGIERFLSSRRKGLQKTISVSERRAKSAGVRIEAPEKSEDASRIFDRLFRIEARGWKAKQGASIFQQREYRQFYLELIRLTLENGSLRVLFAKQDALDVAYVFGSILGPTYRGYQMSYDDSFAPLGIGHLLQIEMMKRVAAEGVQKYDFGMWAEYKDAWTDERQILRTCLFRAS